MKKVLILIIISLFCGGFALAVSPTYFDRPLQEAYIKYQKTGWQTYDFWVLTNAENNSGLKYEWTIDAKETYTTPELHYFFPKGEHSVRVKVEDAVGNVKYDNVNLSMQFWSLQNNWFWWTVYLIIVLVILYYWIVKVVYLLNRKKVKKDVREFLDILDAHGWVDRILIKKGDKSKTGGKLQNSNSKLQSLRTGSSKN